MKGEDLKPLTKDQVEILKKTFRLMDTDRLANRFYDRLFETHPEVKPMFPTDLSELTTKLMSVFELVIFSFRDNGKGAFYLQEDILIPLRTLGKKHTDKGVHRDHYPIANRLLLESIQIEAGYVFPGEATDAWALALQHLSDAMLNTSVNIPEGKQFLFPTIRDSFHYIKERLLKM